MIEKKQHDWMTSLYNDIIESINQNSIFDSLFCKICNINTIIHSSIDRFFIWIDLSTIQRINIFCLFIYLLDIAFFFNNCTSIFITTRKLYAFANQIDAFFSFSFKKFFRFRFRFHFARHEFFYEIFFNNFIYFKKWKLILIQRTKRNRQKHKRMIKNFDHCEIIVKIFVSNFFFFRLFLFSLFHSRQNIIRNQWKILKSFRNEISIKKNKISTTISSTISLFNSSILSKTISKFSIFKSIKQSRNSFISFVIFVATSMQIISSKRSRFSFFTYKIISKRVKIVSSTSFATFTSMFRKSISKFYFTIHDFHRMFVEKLKSFDLRQHQNRRFFSQNLENRRFDRSNLFYQFRIIVYFLFAINQKTSISQNLKSSNSKNFQQFTFAKSISFCRFDFSEKSIFSSYKKSNIFYISLQSKFLSKFSFLQSKFSFAWFRFIFSFSFSSFFRFSFSDFNVCYICFDYFNLRNDLFNYRYFNQWYFSNRRTIKKMKK